MRTIELKAVLEVDSGRGEHGAIICAGDIIGWLPPNVRVGRNEAEAVYKWYCARKFKTLSPDQCAIVFWSVQPSPSEVPK